MRGAFIKFWGCINYKIAGIKKGEMFNTITNQLNKTDMLLISPKYHLLLKTESLDNAILAF